MHAHPLLQPGQLHPVADAETDLGHGHGGNRRGGAQGLFKRLGAEQAVEHARQQRVAGAYGADHADLGRQGLQGRRGAEPVDPLGAVGNHHMLDALGVQLARSLGLPGH